MEQRMPDVTGQTLQQATIAAGIMFDAETARRQREEDRARQEIASKYESAMHAYRSLKAEQPEESFLSKLLSKPAESERSSRPRSWSPPYSPSLKVLQQERESIEDAAARRQQEREKFAADGASLLHRPHDVASIRRELRSLRQEMASGWRVQHTLPTQESSPPSSVLRHMIDHAATAPPPSPPVSPIRDSLMPVPSPIVETELPQATASFNQVQSSVAAKLEGKLREEARDAADTARLIAKLEPDLKQVVAMRSPKQPAPPPPQVEPPVWQWGAQDREARQHSEMDARAMRIEEGVIRDAVRGLSVRGKMRLKATIDGLARAELLEDAMPPMPPRRRYA